MNENEKLHQLGIEDEDEDETKTKQAVRLEMAK